MAVTYKAFDTNLRRFAALKIINPEAFANPDVEGPHLHRRSTIVKRIDPNKDWGYCRARFSSGGRP